MWYIVTLCIGFIMGFSVAAIMSVSGRSDQMQEAYNCGFEKGRQIESELKNKNQ